MKIQFRYRSVGLAALAISLLAIAAFPQTAWAGNANNARAEMAAEKRADNRGQQKQADAEPSEGTPTATDTPSGPTTHGSETGPGGQTCDGDPSGKSDGGTGANGGGENYNDTCASYPDPNNTGADNGAGGGAATGKPCEGCVGNADDKNPPGQFSSGPVDENNGYECDEKGRSANEGNNGVGFGNPAHTGCQPFVCTPTATQNPDCTEKCVPNPATQNADCTPKCVPNPATQNADCSPKCVPTATQNADCTNKTCPAGQTMGTNGTCECPSGQTMGTDGTCSTPCVAGTGAVCSQSTPTCVASSGNERCGGSSVLGEVLGRPDERLDVLGVAIEAPAAVAPAALARTGGFQLTALVQAGLVLAALGLGLLIVGGRRRQTVDIAGRLAGD